MKKLKLSVEEKVLSVNQTTSKKHHQRKQKKNNGTVKKLMKRQNMRYVLF